jgi:hypothetical protein
MAPGSVIEVCMCESENTVVVNITALSGGPGALLLKGAPSGARARAARTE